MINRENSAITCIYSERTVLIMSKEKKKKPV